MLRIGFFLVAYAIVLAVAHATGRAWLDAFAVFALVTLVLWPGIGRGRAGAIVAWLLATSGLAALAVTHRGDIALDFVPVAINVALSFLFAVTLVRGHEPLIARAIAVVESPARLALPRVATYARRLTFAWALFLGLQGLVLVVVALCRVPGGLLARCGVSPPVMLAGNAWPAYLHFGSYAGVLAFFLVEYAYRRWHLRHMEHAALPVFAARLAQRWPMLAHGVIADMAGRDR